MTSNQCKNCSAQVTGGRCEYCGAPHEDYQEPIISRQYENRRVDYAQTSLNATPKFYRSPVWVFVKNLPWGLLLLVIYTIIAGLISGIFGVTMQSANHNFFISEVYTFTGAIRSILLLCFMPIWATIIQINDNNEIRRNGG